MLMDLIRCLPVCQKTRVLPMATVDGSEIPRPTTCDVKKPVNYGIFTEYQPCALSGFLVAINSILVERVDTSTNLLLKNHPRILQKIVAQRFPSRSIRTWPFMESCLREFLIHCSTIGGRIL